MRFSSVSFLAASLTLALSFVAASHAATGPSRGMPDTREWKTHCFGRHLVTLPPDAVIARHTRLQDAAIVPLTDSHTELMNRVEAEIGTHRHGATAAARRIDLDDRSLGLLLPPSADDAGQHHLHAYLVTRPTWRVFDWRLPAGRDGESKALHDASILARHLRSREPTEIPEGIGYCIDGGFIATDLGAMTAQTRIEFTLPGHPGMRFSFLSGMTSSEAAPLLSSIPAGARSVRRERRDAGVLRGHERLLAAGEKTARRYAFAWQSQAAGQPPAALALRRSPADHDGDLAIDTSMLSHPASDRDTLALWDAIVGSIRLRSDGVAPPST